MGIFTVASWITHSCLSYALGNCIFTPKSAKIEIEDVRDLLEDNPIVVVPTLDEALDYAAVKLAEDAATDGSGLDRRIRTLLQEQPDAPSEALAVQLANELDALCSSNEMALLRGMPFFVKKALVHEEAQALLAPFEVTSLVYGFTSAPPNTCDLQQQESGAICWKYKKDHHLHFQGSSLALDYERAVPMLVKRFDGLRTPLPESADGVGPITAETMAAVEEAYRRLTLVEELQQHVPLIQSAIRDMEGFGAIEHLITNGKPENLKEFGRARFTPQPDGSVLHVWLTGVFAFPERQFRYEMVDKTAGGGKRTYLRYAIWKESSPVEIVEYSPAWYALEWYFVRRHEPAQPTDQPKAPEAASSASAGGFEFKGLPYIATIESIDDEIVTISCPTTNMEAAIQRGKNGHPYLYFGEAGRSPIDPGPFREAVLHFWSDVWPTLTQVGAA
jgi:hypothetical protein